MEEGHVVKAQLILIYHTESKVEVVDVVGCVVFDKLQYICRLATIKDVHELHEILTLSLHMFWG